MSESDKATSIQKANNDTIKDVSLNFQFNDYHKFLEYCNSIAKSGLCSLSTKEDVALAISAGKSLGVDVITALNNIYPIEGKATLSVHLMAALLLKAGCIIEVIEDYKPIFAIYHYQYDEQGKVKKKKTPDGKEVPVVLSVEYKFKNDIVNGDVTNFKPIGMGSKVKITRMIKQPDNTFKNMVVEKTFDSFDAAKIPYGNNKTILDKHNYKSYPKNMFYAGAFRPAARLIGSDLIGGLYSTEELLDVKGINYDLNLETGQVVVKNNEPEDVSFEETSN